MARRAVGAVDPARVAGGQRPARVVGRAPAVDRAVDVPELSQRVCPPFGVCNTYSFRAWYGAATCAYAGTLAQRYPTACVDPAGGPAFDHPVQVFTTWDPSVFGSPPYVGPVL